MNHIASPDHSDPGIERQILARGFTAPRVTPADIQANIVGEYYFTAADAIDAVGFIQQDGPNAIPLSLLTFCVLALRNGFTVTGESACASAENFNEEIGRGIARANAVQKIWPLMGYALRTRLGREQALGDAVQQEETKA